jgi:hypothetical protein
VTKILVFAAALAVAPAVFAKGGTAQTHHCEIDGKEVTKTKKDCKAAKGTWAKGAPAAAAASAAK